jgi:predicted aminopeptidase
VRVWAASFAPLLAAGALALAGCSTQPGYLARQGGYLLRYSLGTRSVQSLIADPATPEQTRRFLLEVQDIKRFAVGTIGLKDNGNYTRYRVIDGNHLVDVVSACDAVSFTPYLWRYPLLGKLPYQGFYRRADAEREASRLRAEGYDVLVRPVDAFSTLGFLKDPLYSFMRSYTPFDLASLIIHEQTHATLFLRGQPDFNEELATFVGTEGALEWIRQRYGERSAEYRAAVDENADSETMTGLLHGLAAELQTVYQGPGTREEKLARKSDIIAGFEARLAADRSTLFRTAAYRAPGTTPINNALLSLYRLYSGDVPLLRSYWQRRCGGDLRRFMQAAETLAKRGDVVQLMRAELAGP